MSIGTLQMHYEIPTDVPPETGMVRFTPQQSNNVTPMKGFYSLVIDNSGSVSSPATTVNDDGDKVDNGWSQLDIAKHSTNTLIMSLDDNDYVTLSIYNCTATNLVGWTKCDITGKALLKQIVNSIVPQGATNMVAGLIMGLDMFNSLPITDKTYNKTMIFTTDGIPSSHHHPARGIQGYRPLVEKLLKSHEGYINIYTVGLGSQLDSVLLSDICCNTGEFLHMPDPGAVGPFMVNLIAQCRTIAYHPETNQPANNVYLRLSGVARVPGYERLVEEYQDDIMVPLRNIMCDTPRDIVYIRKSIDSVVQVGLYTKNNNDHFTRITADFIQQVGTIDVTPQWYRQAIIKELERIFNVNAWTANLPLQLESISSLISSIEMDEELEAISKTLNNELLLGLKIENFDKWGRHYLRTLLGALRRGVRTNFRDFILQKYSLNASGKPGFFEVECEKAEMIFSTMEAPTPSRPTSTSTQRPGTVLPEEYMRGGGCFAPECTVDRWNGSEFETITLSDVRPHDELRSREGKAEVKCVVKTICPGGRAEVVKLGPLRLTAWHPVWTGRKWVFPTTLARKSIEPCEYVYNFVLHTDHVLIVSGREVVTLGHGFKHGIVRNSYWGDKVIDDLSTKLGWTSGYIILDTPLKPSKANRRKMKAKTSMASIHKKINRVKIS